MDSSCFFCSVAVVRRTIKQNVALQLRCLNLLDAYIINISAPSRHLPAVYLFLLTGLSFVAPQSAQTQLLNVSVTKLLLHAGHSFGVSSLSLIFINLNLNKTPIINYQLTLPKTRNTCILRMRTLPSLMLAKQPQHIDLND